MGVAHPVQVVHVSARLESVHRAHGGKAQAASALKLKRCQLEARREEDWKLEVSRVALSALLGFWLSLFL